MASGSFGDVYEAISKEDQSKKFPIKKITKKIKEGLKGLKKIMNIL